MTGERDVVPGRPSVRGLVRLLAWTLGGFVAVFAVFAVCAAIGWAG